MANAGIGTKLHKALDYAKAQGLPIQYDILTAGLSVPHYCIDRSIIDLFRSGAAILSVDAMFQAGVAHLPFPKMLVELWTGNPWRYFLLLEELDPEENGGQIVGCELVELVNDGIWPRTMAMDFAYSQNSTKPDLEVFNRIVEDMRLAPPDDGEDVRTPDGRYPSWHVRFTDDTRPDILPHAAAAISAAMLMTHINGLAREKVEVGKLNKARAASGKREIPEHTIVRLGHVYDRSGQKHAIGSGHTMPIHMRAGHVRNQAHGPGMKLRKLVWIEPVLVNYRDGTDLPKPPRKVVKE